jgi:hypothetical protein
MNDASDFLKVKQLIELLNELRFYPDMDGDLHSITTGDAVAYNGRAGWDLASWNI